MSENGAPQPTELVYVAKPTAAPAFLALGLALVVVGIYGNDFMVPGWIYSIIGAVFFLGAARSWVHAARRDLAELPREQQSRSAVLPRRESN